MYATRILLFAFVAPTLFRLPLPSLERLLEPSRRRVAEPSGAEVHALVGLVDRCIARGRPFIRSGCLTRGTTLYYFLRRAGAHVSLRFGIGEMNGTVAGHCWVEYEGEPLAELRDPRPMFVTTWSIEPS